MAVEMSIDLDIETAKTLEELSQKMGISEEEVIKIALKLYEKERAKAKEEKRYENNPASNHF